MPFTKRMHKTVGVTATEGKGQLMYILDGFIDIYSCRSDIPMEPPSSPSEYHVIDDTTTPVCISTPSSFTTMSTLDDIEFGLDDSDIESNTPTVIDDTSSSPIPIEALSVLSFTDSRSPPKQPTANQRALKQRTRTPNPNRTSEEDRIRDLLMDPFVGELEPTRVKCGICEKWFWYVYDPNQRATLTAIDYHFVIQQYVEKRGGCHGIL